jgi:hypothetical protein
VLLTTIRSRLASACNEPAIKSSKLLLIVREIDLASAWPCRNALAMTTWGSKGRKMAGSWKPRGLNPASRSSAATERGIAGTCPGCGHQRRQDGAFAAALGRQRHLPADPLPSRRRHRQSGQSTKSSKLLPNLTTAGGCRPYCGPSSISRAPSSINNRRINSSREPGRGTEQVPGSLPA